MHITTSPPLATSAIACGNAAMSSTNTGSTLPATRSARASEAAVGGNDRRFAGGIDLGQQQGVGVPEHLDEILEAVAGAGVAVRLEGQHQARPGKAPRAAASVAAISTGWWP
jgi:hypothetical protein